MAFVAVKPAKANSRRDDCARQRDDIVSAVLFHPGTVHAGINVDEEADIRPTPALDRFHVVHQAPKR